MNLVLVKHQKDSNKQYLFQVPDNATLKNGDKVACGTMRGTQDGWCCCDSFLADGMTLTAIAQAHGATFPLAPVLGRYLVFREAYAKKPAEHLLRFDDPLYNDDRSVKPEISHTDECERECRYDALMQKYTAKCKAYDELDKAYHLAKRNIILATTKLLKFAESNAEAALEIERLWFDYVECRDAHDRLHDYCRDLEEEHDKLKAQLKQIRDFVERESKNETV